MTDSNKYTNMMDNDNNVIWKKVYTVTEVEEPDNELRGKCLIEI